MNILLDYFFPITAIEPTPAANTGFLKQALAVVAPAGGVTPGEITLCTSALEVAALTENTAVNQVFAAGMSRIYVLPMATLDLASAIEGHEADFHTIIISGDFDDTALDSLDVGAFTGVVGVQSQSTTKVAAQAAIENRVAFFSDASNKAANMFYAFGKLLSNPLRWSNQQYITMPFNDGITTLGQANARFDDRASFVLNDSQYGNRLALFSAGGKAITAPYVTRNLELDFQSAALSYISGNQPAYSLKQAALIEDELQKVIQDYIDREMIEAGEVQVKLEQDNFVASGYINISEPKALWRIFGEMRQTL